ncbi:MAG: hypothetical protein WCK98_08095 [bacterium]
MSQQAQDDSQSAVKKNEVEVAFDASQKPEAEKTPIATKNTSRSNMTLPFIIIGVAVFLVVAVISGALFYSSYQKKLQKDYVDGNFTIYSEALDKTIETFNAQDTEKVETQEQVKKIKAQLDQTQALVKQKQASLKTNPPAKVQSIDKQITAQFTGMSTLLEKTVIYTDLGWCVTPNYVEFVNINDQIKAISKDSKFFDTFPNLKIRFDKAATLTAGLQAKIDASLVCFDTYAQDSFKLTDDLKTKIVAERDRYKNYVVAYTEMSQAAAEQNNTKLVEAQKKVESFYLVYFESSLKSYFTSIASSLRLEARSLENSRVTIEKNKNDIIAIS